MSNPGTAHTIEVEVTAAFDAYEAALRENDVVGMDGWFWQSTETVRFGLADMQHGYDEVIAWRAAAPGVAPGRVLFDTRVLVLSDEVAVVTTCFGYPFLGRQTQVWLRLHSGWRIASAHVSEIPIDEAIGGEARA